MNRDLAGRKIGLHDPEHKVRVRDQPAKQLTSTHIGDIVIVRYYDHVLFKDALSSQIKPFIREALGWLDYKDTEYVRLVWERFAEPIIGEESRFRTTGLAIRRADIIELRRLRGSS